MANRYSGDAAAAQLLSLVRAQNAGQVIHVLDLGTAVERPSCEISGRIVGLRLERHADRPQLRLLMHSLSGYLHTVTWRFAAAPECFDTLKAECGWRDSLLSIGDFWGCSMVVR